VFGNRIVYDYQADGATRLIKRVRYVDLPGEGPNRFPRRDRTASTTTRRPVGVAPEAGRPAAGSIPCFNFRGGFETG